MMWVIGSLLILSLLAGYQVGLQLADQMNEDVPLPSLRGGQIAVEVTTPAAVAFSKEDGTAVDPSFTLTNRPLPTNVGRAPTRPLGLDLESVAAVSPSDNMQTDPFVVKTSDQSVGIDTTDTVDTAVDTAAATAVPSSTVVSSSTANRGTPIMSTVKRLFALGKSDPQALLLELDTKDVFGTADPASFLCPTDPSERIERNPAGVFNTTRAALFKQGNPDSWLFYQHLRKAGGTGFCELARRNMEKRSIPPYYCMPDNRGSLATPPWNDESFILSQLKSKGHRMASNEWDSYQLYMGTWDHAVYATTFRDPIDRWYSQYKFEYLEHRDGSSPNAPRPVTFLQWYKQNKDWMMTSNYYIKTFMGTVDKGLPHGQGDFYWTYHKFQHVSINEQEFLQALMNLRHFNLILVMEYLDLELTTIVLDKVLGWKAPPTKIRPHDQQAPNRESLNNLAIRSSSSKKILPPIDYAFVSQDNALDMLFYHVVLRVFLERVACHMHG